MVRYTILLILLWGMMSQSAASQPVSNLKKIREQYPFENIVILNNKRHINIGIENGALQIASHYNHDRAYISDKASNFSEKSISYSEEMENISSIEAISYVNEGSKFKKHPVTEFTDRKVSKEGIFYDDVNEKSFIYPGLKNGSITTLKYTENLKRPQFLGAFYFSSFAPVQNAEFSISFPEDVRIGYIIQGDSTGISFSKNKSGKLTTYSWKASECAAISMEENAPDFRYYTPHILVYIVDYTIDGKKHKVLSDTRRLYEWYHELVKDVNKSADLGLKSLADSIVAGTASDEEKIKRIYNWVQDNIRYIAFEYGMGGFVPRQASEVESKKYGDCKDMSSLITSLLKAVNIPAYLTWIGTRDIPYSYHEVPLPNADNHMIAATKFNGKWLFLDGTTRYGAAMVHPAGIQDKEALIGISSDSFVVAKVPVHAKEINFKTDTVILNIEGKNLKGKAVRHFGGLQKTTVVSLYHISSSENRKKLFKEILSTGNNKCSITEESPEGINMKDGILSIRYSMLIPEYLTQVENDIYVNLHLDKPLLDDDIDIEKRKHDRTIGYKSMDNNVFELMIPDGYALIELPENTSFNHPSFGFEFTYKKMEGKIILERKFYIDTILLQKKDFTEWNKMVKLVGDAYSQVLVLRKN